VATEARRNNAKNSVLLNQRVKYLSAAAIFSIESTKQMLHLSQRLILATRISFCYAQMLQFLEVKCQDVHTSVLAFPL
jgi:hypothetical protein